MDEKESKTIEYKQRKRIQYTRNSRGTSVETTCEVFDMTNEEAIREAKDLYARAVKAIEG